MKTCETENIGILCICAVRYCLGRQTYMPSVVQDIIRAYMSKLDRNDLAVIEKSVADAEIFGGYGDEQIDKPGWIKFLADVRAELDSRNADKTDI